MTLKAMTGKTILNIKFRSKSKRYRALKNRIAKIMIRFPHLFMANKLT
jgi:hypothetical protein